MALERDRRLPKRLSSRSFLAVAGAIAALAATPTLAQQSASYKLNEFAMNEGGHPADGAILASASFRIKLDAIGDGLASPTMSSSGFHMDASFVATYPPPGEVRGLGLLPSAKHFIDREQVHLAELRCVSRRRCFRTRPVVVAAGDVLPLRTV